jgi:hypothetical protein
MATKTSSVNFIFDLLRNHLPHDDETDDSIRPLTNWEFVLALVLVTAFLFLIILGFRALIT